MNETLLIIATAIAGAIGSPLVQGIKNLMAAAGKPIEGSAALYLTVGTSVVLGGVTLIISGVFSPPYPADWQGWVTLAGGSVGSIFAIATVIFKKLVQPVNVGAG